MGHLVQQTGDDEYRVWSTVVDAFIIEHADAAELETYYALQAAKEAREKAKKWIAEARDLKEAVIDARRFGVPVSTYIKQKIDNPPVDA